MANNIEYLIEELRFKKKDVADYLGISMQSLSSMLNVENPRKYCEKLSNLFQISTEYITKELSEEDKKRIILTHYDIPYIEDYREEIILTYEARKVAKEVDILQVKEILNKWSNRDIDAIKVTIDAKYMHLPKTNYKDAKIFVDDESIQIYRSRINLLFDFEVILIKKITQIYDSDLIFLIFELLNGLNIYITIDYVV